MTCRNSGRSFSNSSARFRFQISIFAFKKNSHTPTHRLAGHSSTVLALQMTPLYIVSCANADVRVWSRETKTHLRNLWGHRGPIASLRVHGDSVITASEVRPPVRNPHKTPPCATSRHTP